MNIKCLLFGHSFKALEEGVFFELAKETAAHEYDGIRVYQCTRCGKKIKQEEHFR